MAEAAKLGDQQIPGMDAVKRSTSKIFILAILCLLCTMALADTMGWGHISQYGAALAFGALIFATLNRADSRRYNFKAGINGVEITQETGNAGRVADSEKRPE